MSTNSLMIPLLTLLTTLAAPPDTLPPIPDMGINSTGLSMKDTAVREKTLENIQSLGATWFRDGPSSGTPAGVANFVDEVRRANREHLKVLVIVNQKDEDYDYPLVKNRCNWNEKKLSGIDLKKYAQRLRNLLVALRAAHCTIDAVEFGSEFDQYCYDADVPNGHEASPAEILTWLRGYGHFLQTGALVLHDPQCYPQAKIITFGIAHASDEYDKPSHHLSSPAKVVAMLKDVDGFNYLDNAGYHVDGYGTHIYPGPNNVGGAFSSLMHQDIWALGRDKPIWITEWGFLDPKQYPTRTGKTLDQALNEVLDSVASFRKRVPIGPVFFYSYDSGLVDGKGNLSGLVDGQGNFVPAAAVLLARAKGLSSQGRAVSRF